MADKVAMKRKMRRRLRRGMDRATRRVMVQAAGLDWDGVDREE